MKSLLTTDSSIFKVYWKLENFGQIYEFLPWLMLFEKISIELMKFSWIVAEIAI